MLNKIKDTIVIHTARLFYGYDSEDLWLVAGFIFVGWIILSAYGIDGNAPA